VVRALELHRGFPLWQLPLRPAASSTAQRVLANRESSIALPHIPRLNTNVFGLYVQLQSLGDTTRHEPPLRPLLPVLLLQAAVFVARKAGRVLDHSCTTSKRRSTSLFGSHSRCEPHQKLRTHLPWSFEDAGIHRTDPRRVRARSVYLAWPIDMRLQLAHPCAMDLACGEHVRPRVTLQIAMCPCDNAVRFSWFFCHGRRAPLEPISRQ
jgi:hypothetical protein